jgi:transcriptional regulator with XRE-family HTH domain
MTLATKAGLHLNAIGSLERGLRSPTLPTVFALCRALDVPVTKFFAALEKQHPGL